MFSTMSLCCTHNLFQFHLPYLSPSELYSNLIIVYTCIYLLICNSADEEQSDESKPERGEWRRYWRPTSWWGYSQICSHSQSRRTREGICVPKCFRLQLVVHRVGHLNIQACTAIPLRKAALPLRLCCLQAGVRLREQTRRTSNTKRKIDDLLGEDNPVVAGPSKRINSVDMSTRAASRTLNPELRTCAFAGWSFVSQRIQRS